MEKLEKIIAKTTHPIGFNLLLNQIVEAVDGNNGPFLIHSSLSQLGWVIGGVQTLWEALDQGLGHQATFVMPSQTFHLTDPALWSDPQVPSSWWDEVRNSMPVYDPILTPPWKMGQLVNYFWNVPGTFRSSHPQASFLARGPLASEIIKHHPLEMPLGPKSPLRRLYEMDAVILLLGVGWDSCTAFHLAEYLQKGVALNSLEFPAARKSGITQWNSYRDIEYNSEVFPWIGRDLENHPRGGVVSFKLGQGRAKLLPVKTAVDGALHWLKEGDLENWNPELDRAF